MGRNLYEDYRISKKVGNTSDRLLPEQTNPRYPADRRDLMASQARSSLALDLFQHLVGDVEHSLREHRLLASSKYSAHVR